MRYLRIALIISVFLVSYVAFLIHGLPATWAARRLDARLAPIGASLSQTQGSAWQGRGTLIFHGTDLGRLDWHTSVWPLVTGELSAAVQLRSPNLQVHARLMANGHGVRIENLQGEAALPPLAKLADLPTTLNGTLVATVAKATFDNHGNIGPLQGHAEIRHASLPELGVKLGTLILRFTPGSRGSVGDFHNSGGDLDLSGQLTLTPNGAYVLDAELRPHAGQNQMRDALSAMLGAPDGQGRYHYHQAGRFSP